MLLWEAGVAMDAQHTQVLVVGAGIAGASVAAELAMLGADVVLLEREAQPGYHTTGRSAALYTAAYGPPAIRALTRASGPAFRHSPGVHPLLRPRGAMFLARTDQEVALGMLEAELRGAARRIDAAAAMARLPILRPGYLSAALIDDQAADIDVDALHRMYLRRLVAAGGRFFASAEVQALSREGGGWCARIPQGFWHAEIVINAAGAWADELARQAGVATVGLVPKRRTALLVDVPAGRVADAWPMAVDVEERFYLKPDAGKLLLSPADETPSPPCDASPDEMDVAVCIDRIQLAFDLPVRRVAHKWAGLRSFVADKCPVAGFAPDAPGFFWLAGQGGYGIQTAPALARLAAALALGRPVPSDIADEGVCAMALAPARAELAA
ncbi:MAG: NAD(P)/FAD-dependent oxidoreductase [Pararhodobacter sp.]